MRVLFLLFIVIFSCSNKICEDKAKKKTKPVNIKYSEVKERSIALPIVSSGITMKKQESRLSFKTGGIIDQFFVQEGDIVEKGSLMASLKRTEIQSRCQKAESAYKKAKRDHERTEALYKDEVVTLEQLQNARTGLDIALADLKAARFNLSHSEIQAPEKGIVLKKFQEVEEMIGSGKPVILFGSGINNWTIRLGLSDNEIIRIAPGDSALVSYSCFPGKEYKANVLEMANSSTPGTGTFEVDLNLEEHPGKLKSGMIANVKIYPKDPKTYKIIPIEAMVEGNKLTGSTYSLDTSTNHVEKRYFQIGAILEKELAVSSGLEDIHFVVTEGSAYLKKNCRVRRTNNETP